MQERLLIGGNIMRNRFFVLIVMAAVACMVLGLVVLPGCGKKEEATEKEEAEKMSYLFSQDAESGALTKESDDTYTLTLNGVSGLTGVFADRPVREAHTEDTGDFVSSFKERFGDNPPNAALHFEPKDGKKEIDVAVFTVSDPTYDKDSRTLTYKAVIIPLEEGEVGFTPEGEALAQLPSEFGATSLFIDGQYTLIFRNDSSNPGDSEVYHGDPDDLLKKVRGF